MVRAISRRSLVRREALAAVAAIVRLGWAVSTGATLAASGLRTLCSLPGRRAMRGKGRENPAAEAALYLLPLVRLPL